ncbi:MAG: hypothetical protein PHO01_06270 [Desulfotomaculaceae bacterium]|nr:hypothetical protein [Desulfotomaculaceae bacterium]
MAKKDESIDNQTISYQLTPEQLNEVLAKYGQPGESSPGIKARGKRRNKYQTGAPLKKPEPSGPSE